MSDFPINVDDNNDDDKNEEGHDEETTYFVIFDYEECKEKEATEEETQDDEETNLVKIAVAVISSLPYSPSKLVTTSSPKISLMRLIVNTNVNTNVQLLYSPI